MKAIYKYELDLIELQTLLIPLEEVLDIQVVNGKIYLWAIVNKVVKPKSINFICFGTGQEFSQDVGKFIKTVSLGQFIFHWFMKEVK